MTKKFTDFKQLMAAELTRFLEMQAGALSDRDLHQLIVDLPALRKRSANIPALTCPYLAEKLEFLCDFVEERVVQKKHDLTDKTVAEAAFALIYFQRGTDLIPDSIPDIGLLDDAIIIDIVLGRHEAAFRDSLRGPCMRWPASTFEIDDLLSVISPLRVNAFCSSLCGRQAG